MRFLQKLRNINMLTLQDFMFKLVAVWLGFLILLQMFFTPALALSEIGQANLISGAGRLDGAPISSGTPAVTSVSNLDFVVHPDKPLSSEVDQLGLTVLPAKPGVVLARFNQADMQALVSPEETVLFDKTDAEWYQINSATQIPLEFYEWALPEGLKQLAPEIVRVDSHGINSLYFTALVITEVGRDPSLMGDNNYGNYTADTIKYMDFEHIHEFTDYTIKRYEIAFFNEEWHEQRPYNKIINTGNATYDFSDSVFTIPEVNMGYATIETSPGRYEVNWLRSDVVSDVMMEYSNKYVEWYDMVTQDQSNY